MLIVGGVGVVLLLRPDLPVAVGIAPMVLLGLGFGLPLGFVDAETLAAVPSERAGAASGVINLLRIGSEAVFVAAYAAILAAIVTTTLPRKRRTTGRVRWNRTPLDLPRRSRRRRTDDDRPGGTPRDRLRPHSPSVGPHVSEKCNARAQHGNVTLSLIHISEPTRPY